MFVPRSKYRYIFASLHCLIVGACAMRVVYAFVYEKPYDFACGHDDDEEDGGDENDDDGGDNDVEIRKEVKNAVSEIVLARTISRNRFSEVPFVADMLASTHCRTNEGLAMTARCALGMQKTI